MQRETPPALPAWIESELPHGTNRYACRITGDMRIHVLERGSGTAVFMLHGNPTWGFLYRKIIASLSEVPLRCIAPDLIGLGFSSKPGDMEAHTVENHARWIGELIDQLAPDRLIFVGQDWGGPIGIRALADRADRLAGLVLLNTAVQPPRPGFKPTAFHRFSHFPIVSGIAFRILGFPQNMLHKVQGDPASIKGNVARAYRYPLKRYADNLAPLALARMVPDSQEHPSVPHLEVCRDFLSSFGGPVELVWGKKDPILGRAAKRTREIFPTPPRVTETGAGHFLQEEVPDQIAAAIRRVHEQI